MELYNEEDIGGKKAMRCPRCDAKVSDTAVQCTFCGQDLSVVHYVWRVSNTYYNRGLERAGVRDLSGAAEILKKSLQYNKRNTNARNLLGLIYYEMGETVVALSEWVLSKYLQPEDNAADYYISTLQSDPTSLEATNQTIKKYNAALMSAQAGNEDLAIIQLKKVVSLNPHFVRAQQLLALLYIKTKDYPRAAKCLNRARKIDFNNTTTLRYMQEVGDQVAAMERRANAAVKNPAKPKKDPLSNVTPVGTYKEEKRSMMPVVYVILGIIFGIVVSFVLIRPTFLKQMGGSGSEIADANSKIAVQTTRISTLEKEKESLDSEMKRLKQELEKGNTEALKKVENYEKLLAGVNYYVADDLVQAAVSVSKCKKTDFDSSEAKDIYTKIATVPEEKITALVRQGRNEMNSSYDTAIATFKKVLSVDKDNQEAMFCMGRCYQHKNNNKTAKKWYEKAIEVDGTSTFATQAQQYLAQVGGTSTAAPTTEP